MKKIIVTVFLLSFAVFSNAQQTVTITASQDNTMYQTPDGSTSNGAGIYLFSGRTNQAASNLRRAVVKFDLTGKLPENAVITGAKLKLNVSKTITGASTVNVHRLLANWGEGTSDAGSNEGGGAPSTNNDVTWLHRFFNTQNWTAPGGNYHAQKSASKTVSGTGAYTWEDTLLVSDVVSWNASPGTNFGWIIIGDESAQSAKRFDSRSTTNAANRPQLIIEFTVPTSVSGSVPSAAMYSLGQNFPNPFNPTTAIAFTLPQSGLTQLAVYDLLGTRVALLVDGHVSAGPHRVEFNGADLSSGIYFYRLQSGTYTSVKKLMLLK